MKTERNVWRQLFTIKGPTFVETKFQIKAVHIKTKKLVQNTWNYLG